VLKYCICLTAGFLYTNEFKDFTLENGSAKSAGWRTANTLAFVSCVFRFCKIGLSVSPLEHTLLRTVAAKSALALPGHSSELNIDINLNF
jgi:hypothetical protein